MAFPEVAGYAGNAHLDRNGADVIKTEGVDHDVEMSERRAHLGGLGLALLLQNEGLPDEALGLLHGAALGFFMPLLLAQDVDALAEAEQVFRRRKLVGLDSISAEIEPRLPRQARQIQGGLLIGRRAVLGQHGRDRLNGHGRTQDRQTDRGPAASAHEYSPRLVPS